MAREILIADGNKAAHKAFEEIFKETDYNLIFSENGEDALLKMKLSKPALVIADVTMPDKNGKELCEMLKGDPNLNKIPFVLLGGPFDEDIEEEKKQVRANGAITKPLQGEPILKLVDGLLTPRPVEASREVKEEILELQPMAEVTEAVSSQGEEEIIDLLDIIEEPVARAEEAPAEVPGEAMKGVETRESEGGGLVEESALADLELAEDMEFPKAEEAIQAPEMEGPAPEPGVPEKVDVKTEPAVTEGEISSEEGIGKVSGTEEQYPGPPEGTFEPERGGFGAEESVEEVPTEEMGELLQDILKGKGLEEAFAEEGEQPPLEEISEPARGELGAEESTEELPTEGMGELPQDILKGKGLEEAFAEEGEQPPLEEISEPARGELGAEESTEEVPTEGMGELPQDILKGKGLEEALAEEIEELPGDFLGEEEPKETSRELEDTPDEGKAELEGLGELGREAGVPREEEGALEEALKELPGEVVKEGELEELPGGNVSIEELGGLEELGEKTDVVRDEEGALEEALKELHREAPEEGKAEKLPEGNVSIEELGGLEELGEKTDGGRDEEGALEEALKELPGEILKEGELEELPGEQLPGEELEGLPQEVSHEMDLEGLAEKVLNEEDLQAFGEKGLEKEGLEEFYEEVFKEGELEKIAEEVTRDQEKEEIPEGALAEAIEEFTGETVRGEEETGLQPSPERPVPETISGAIKELVEGMSAKILPQLTEAIAAAAAERIEKTVQKIVPKMAEEAIQKEIQRLEKIKKGEDFDI